MKHCILHIRKTNIPCSAECGQNTRPFFYPPSTVVEKANIKLSGTTQENRDPPSNPTPLLRRVPDTSYSISDPRFFSPIMTGCSQTQSAYVSRHGLVIVIYEVYLQLTLVLLLLVLLFYVVSFRIHFFAWDLEIWVSSLLGRRENPAYRYHLIFIQWGWFGGKDRLDWNRIEYIMMSVRDNF